MTTAGIGFGCSGLTLLMQASISASTQRSSQSGRTGVTTRSVQNCTLSRQGLEHRTNLAQRPKRRGGGCLGPDIVAGQTNMLPPERCDMGQQIIGITRPLQPQLPDGAVEIDRVPMNDGGSDEAQPRRAEALVFEGAVSNSP